MGVLAATSRSVRRTALAAVAALAAITAAGTASAQTAIRFALDWRFEGPSALFLTGIERGHFKAEGLDVTIDPGSGSRESITRVASGTYQMGFGDVNSLVRFRDENPGVDLKAVMMVYDRPPFAIIGRKSRGITTDVKSLVGKRFGAPAVDAAFAQWPIFRTVNKLDESTMRFENVGFPVREPMLAQGEVDAVFGFSMSSYINLKARGVPADDIVLMLMSDYGVELYGNVVLVHPQFLQQNPEAVRGFLRALVKSIRDVVKDPATAADYVIKRNDVAKKDVELERLKMVLDQNVVTPWVKANGIGGIDAGRFARAIDQIGLTFQFKNKPKPEDIFDSRFLPTERNVM